MHRTRPRSRNTYLLVSILYSSRGSRTSFGRGLSEKEEKGKKKKERGEDVAGPTLLLPVACSCICPRSAYTVSEDCFMSPLHSLINEEEKKEEECSDTLWCPVGEHHRGWFPEERQNCVPRRINARQDRVVRRVRQVLALPMTHSGQPQRVRV
jgi:hypothetical protein